MTDTRTSVQKTLRPARRRDAHNYYTGEQTGATVAAASENAYHFHERASIVWRCNDVVVVVVVVIIIVTIVIIYRPQLLSVARRRDSVRLQFS